MKRKIKGLLFAALCCIGLLCADMDVSAESFKENAQFDIRVTYGYGNSVKIGKNAAFHVSVENYGEAFSGTLKLMTAVYAEDGYFSYSSSGLNLPYISSSYVRYYDNYGLKQEFAVASGETEEAVFTLPFTSSAPYVKVVLSGADGEIAAEKIIQLTVRSASAEILAGILTDDPEGMQYLNGVHLSDFSNISVSVVALTEQMLEDSSSGLDMLDVLIIQNFDMDKLDDAQENAVRRFVLQGGVLVFGNAAGEEAGDRPGEPQIRRYGDGKILKYSGSLALRGEERYSLQGKQANTLLEQFFSKEYLTDLDSGGYYLNTDGYWDVMSRLDSIDAENIPGMGRYVLVLAVYVILAGPVIYLVLKKLKVRKYIWGCVGILSVVFSAVIFLMGSSTRFNAPFVNYIRTLRITDGYEDESVEFEVRAPYNKSYSVYVNPDYEILPVSEAGYYSLNDLGNADFSRESLELSYGEKEIQLTMAADRAFTEKFFRAQKSEKKEADYGIFGSLNYFDGTVTGSVENLTGYDLEDACVFFRNHLIYIGDFPAGSRKDLGEQRLYAFTPGYGYQIVSSCLDYKEGYTKEITEEFLETSWQRDLLCDCLQEGYSGEGETCTLVGFTGDGEMDLMEDSAYKMYGQTLVCADMDLSLEEDINGCTWLYDPFVTATAEVISGNYDTYSNVYYSKEVVLMYTLPEDLTEISLVFGENTFFNTEYYKDFGGTAELYNFQTGSYEEVSVEEEVTWDRLRDCVSESGQLMIRYQRMTDPQELSEMLPVITVKGRKTYAED